MRPLILKPMIVILLSITTLAAFGKAAKVTKHHRSLSQSKLHLENQSWQQQATSVIHAKGLTGKKAVACARFYVSMKESLIIDIECGDIQRKGQLLFDSNEQQTVSRYGDQLTITQFDFLLKKPQTSRLQQSVLKIPFVSDVIHVKKNTDGTLALYLETFELDQFGRIVQSSLLQAHGLALIKKKIKAKNTEVGLNTQ